MAFCPVCSELDALDVGLRRCCCLWPGIGLGTRLAMMRQSIKNIITQMHRIDACHAIMILFKPII